MPPRRALGQCASRSQQHWRSAKSGSVPRDPIVMSQRGQVHRGGAAPGSFCSDCNFTILCIEDTKHFRSASLRSAKVSRCAARAKLSIWRSNCAPDFVSRQICARRSRRSTERLTRLRACRRLRAPVVVVRSSATSAAKVVWSAVPRSAIADRRLYCSGVISNAPHRL